MSVCHVLSWPYSVKLVETRSGMEGLLLCQHSADITPCPSPCHTSDSICKTPFRFIPYSYPDSSLISTLTPTNYPHQPTLNAAPSSQLPVPGPSHRHRASPKQTARGMHTPKSPANWPREKKGAVEK